MRWGALAAWVALAGVAVAAHHSLSGVYDGGRQVTLDGVIVEFQLVRPHPFLVFDVERDDRVERWRGELDNLRELTAIGVTQDTFRPGDRVTIAGSPARRADHGVYVRRLDRASDGFWYEQLGYSPRIGIAPP